MNCFVDALKSEIQRGRSRWRWLINFALGMSIPTAVPLIVLFLLKHYSLEYIRESRIDIVQVYANVLKLTSIMLLAYHTYGSAEQISSSSQNIDYGPVSFYRITSIYMVLITIILTIHTAALMIPDPYSPDKTKFAQLLAGMGAFAHNEYWLYTIGIAAFLYMPAFLCGNFRFISKNKGNLGVECFSNAFIFGVNLPSIAAFIIIIAISYYAHDIFKEPGTFLAGSIAFLIYSSTAACICIDHYARPFLSASAVKCEGPFCT